MGPCVRRDDIREAAHLQTRPHPLAARCARVVAKTSAPKGRGECRAPSAPAASCAQSSGKCTRVFTAVAPKITRHPRTQWLRLIRTLPGDRAFLPPSPRESYPQDLTPASRRQDHTTWPSALGALVRSASRVHRIPPRVRDDRDTPLLVGRDGDGYAGDLGRHGTGIFFAMGLDSPNHTKSSPSGVEFLARRMGGANGSRECAPDDKLRDTRQLKFAKMMGVANPTS
jgi:hypothetical protein